MENQYKEWDTNESIVRIALWRAYDCCDAYTKNPIQYREMEIDHVFPIAWFKDTKRLSDRLIQFNLDKSESPRLYRRLQV